MGLFRKRNGTETFSASVPASTLANGAAGTDLPIWPSGIARFEGGILEVTTGDGFRVAAGDILEIGVEPPRAGRLSLRVAYRAGLDKPKRSYWVEPQHEAALRELVRSVGVARGGAS
jgi:hypothetical protein